MKNDLISRSSAIEAIEKHIRTAEEPYQLTDADKVMNHAFEIAASCVYNLSAAQPDSLVRPSSRWMSVGHKRARICLHCFKDEPYKFADHDANIYDFCPHCGAKMEVIE